VPEEPPSLGHPLADESASSTSENVPGFLAKPANAPVYHGFRVLRDVAVDGFIFGAITDFEAQASSEGDAFVIAPDDSRAGLVWEVSDKKTFIEVSPLTADRWGVWEVSFPLGMTSRENARLNLQAILPKLKPKWEQWRRTYKGIRDLDV
jgi:hypothetical protein